MLRPRNSIPEFSIDRNGRAFTKVDGRFVFWDAVTILIPAVYMLRY